MKNLLKCILWLKAPLKKFINFKINLSGKEINIILASHNESKFIEFKNILKQIKVKPLLLKNFTSIAPKENGKSFKENALIKARYASKVINYSMPSIADDSGICIKKLDDQPGIYSARWAKENNYIYAFNKIKNHLKKKNIIMNQEIAKFVCVLALIDINKKEYIYEGTLDGKLTFPPRGKFGFGYDSIFIPNGYNKTLAELSSNVKDKISHRGKAIQKLFSNILFINKN